MKKVAILKSGVSHRGGLEKYANRLATAFVDRGCEVTILTSLRRHEKGATLTSNGPYKVEALCTQTWFGALNRLQFNRAVNRWLKDNPQDIVFGMDRNTHQTHYRVGEGVHRDYLRRRRQISPWYRRFSFPLNPLHRVNLALEKATFTNPDVRAYFTNSHMTRDQVLEHYPVDPARIHVVHNGVEWEEMRDDFEAWPGQAPLIKKSLGLDPDRYQFLLIAQGWGRKGLKFLLDGLAKLPHNAWQLSVIGREKRPNPYLRQIKRLGLTDNVKIYGLRADVRRFLQMADCLVVPSLYDPFANVTVEALAMGLLVVSSKYNGGKEVITPDTGLIIPNLTDPTSMANTLALALERPKTGESARRARQAVRHLDFSTQLDKIVDVTLAS
jgi:UDP-glucose:(heptosyl)LPS alpha-1,3-glucosyltransferase